MTHLFTKIYVYHTRVERKVPTTAHTTNVTSLTETVRKHHYVLVGRPGETTVLRDRHRAGLPASYHPPPLCSNNCSGSGDENYACASNIIYIYKNTAHMYIYVHIQYTYT